MLNTIYILNRSVLINHGENKCEKSTIVLINHEENKCEKSTIGKPKKIHKYNQLLGNVLTFRLYYFCLKKILML